MLLNISLVLGRSPIAVYRSTPSQWMRNLANYIFTPINVRIRILGIALKLKIRRKRVKTAMKTWALAGMMFVGFFLAHASASSEGALEQARIETFADALMDETVNYIFAHVTGVADGPAREKIWKWYDVFSHPVAPCQLIDSCPVQLPSIVFRFREVGVRIPRPKLEGPIFVVTRDTEWFLILGPLQDREGELLMTFMREAGVNDALTAENVLKVFRSGNGAICVKDDRQARNVDCPICPKEKLYPVAVVQEVCRIRDVMSASGDTNALLALEAELEVDFSRKLVQEIVRRKQPPTQEEIWREEIAALWRGGWSGAAARGEDIWELIKNYERQFRTAHAAGEISDDTYLEMMKLLRLDLIKDPNATHLNRR